MLWTKAWLETRWRFLIGLIVLMCSAAGVVFVYPYIQNLIGLTPPFVEGEIGRRIRENAELLREYRGYVWVKWFRENLVQLGTIFAVLLGTGGLIAQQSGGAALFTLSLPVSRKRLVGVRAATGLAELFLLAFVPSLVIPLLSPMVNQHYGAGSALVHSACMFVGSSVFFFFAMLLSTWFADIWRPVLIALGVAILLGIGEQVIRGLAPYCIYRVMNGQRYFLKGELPWTGLLISVAASAAMAWLAAVNMERRDF
jgi:ABC-2 type transport system permease protein